MFSNKLILFIGVNNPIADHITALKYSWVYAEFSKGCPVFLGFCWGGGGVCGMFPRENLFKLCNLVRFGKK